MKKVLLLLLSIVLIGCSSVFIPIVKTYGYHHPVASAELVNQVPKDAKYIGTISIVPNDLTYFRSWNKNAALFFLLTEAAKAGANYVYLTQIETSHNDYWWNKESGQGYTINAELYY